MKGSFQAIIMPNSNTRWSSISVVPRLRLRLAFLRLTTVQTSRGWAPKMH